MANITRREGKLGVSYRIRVTDRRRGMQYSMTWPQRGEHIPETWGEARINKELQKTAFEFEQKCLKGYVSSEHTTFGEYAEYAIEQKEREGIKHSTIVRYLEMMKRINDKNCRGIGSIKLKDLRPEDLNLFYATLAKPGMNRRTGGHLSNKTISEYHRFISTVLNLAVRERKIPENITKLAICPKNKKTTIHSLELEDLHRVLEALKTEPIKYQAITQLLIATGARRGEIMGLKWTDINFEKCTVNICRNLLYLPGKGIYEDTTKTGIEHLLSVSAASLEPLRKWRTEQSLERLHQGEFWTDTGYVFTQKDGKPMCPDSITEWLPKFAKRHGLPHLHPHLFRHTHASLLIASNVDVVSVSKRLGHAKVSTTEDFYAHPLRDADIRAAEVFDSLLNGQRAV